MAEKQFQCPHCGRVGSTTRAIPPGASARCPGCQSLFKIEGAEPRPVRPPMAGLLTGQVAPTSPSQPTRVPAVEPSDARPPRRVRMAVAVGVGSGVLAASVAIGAAWLILRNPAPPPTVTETLTTEQVAARSEASVAFIAGPAGPSGTGFLISDGLVATNAHVIDSIPPDQIQITFPAAPELDRGPILGRVVYFEPNRDLAILRVSTRLPPLKTAVNHKFRRGQDVVVIGNPGVGPGRSFECVVSRGVLGSEVVEANQTFYQLSGSINLGNSGGPVLDLSGQVVGVVTLKASKQEGLGLCIPAPDLASTVQRVLTQLEPSAREAARQHAMTVKASEAAERFAALKGRTDPGTWIAMIDLNRELTDDAPEAAVTRSILDQVDHLYAEDRRGIALLVLRVVKLAKESGDPISACEVLAGSLDYASPYYFSRGRGVEFSEYAKLYALFHNTKKTHEATMASVRALYRATAGVFDPKPAPARQPVGRDLRDSQRLSDSTPEPTSPNLPNSPSLPSSPILTEALRLGRSLEGQKKTRGALRQYRDLVEDHPGTAEAAEAAERLVILTRPPSFGNRRPAKVLEVRDGMTIVVDLGGSRTSVRLLGLDPLPKKRSVSPQGSWEKQATEFLRSLVEGRSVHLDYERGASQSDGAGHTLAYVYRADDLLAINREMIARGYAVGSRFGSFSQAEDFRDADARAHSRRVGLWAP